MNGKRNAALPVRHNLTAVYIASLAITLLMTAASVAGLLYRSVIYPAEDLLLSFWPNDVINLFIGVPILLGSMGLARRGKIVGLLFWPGALLFVLYNYLAYLFAIPVNAVFLLYLSLVALSAYTIIALVASIESDAVAPRLSGAVPERTAGGILAGFGILFSLRVIAVIIGALVDQAPPAGAELSTLVSDFIISPTFIIGGILLWQRKPLGYTAGLGLLFQLSMLFIGLIMLMLLQPLLTAAPLVLVDVIVVFVMGLVCFVPFGLFIRGVLSPPQPSSAQGQ